MIKNPEEYTTIHWIKIYTGQPCAVQLTFQNYVVNYPSLKSKPYGLDFRVRGLSNKPWLTRSPIRSLGKSGNDRNEY